MVPYFAVQILILPLNLYFPITVIVQVSLED